MGARWITLAPSSSTWNLCRGRGIRRVMARWSRWSRVVGSLVAASVLTGCGAATGSATSSQGAASGLEGFVPQSVVTIVGADAVVVAGSLPCGRRVCAALLRGRLDHNGLVRRWRRLGVPPISPARDAASLDVGDVAFANGEDGYDVIPPATPSAAVVVYATVDGGETWRRTSIPSGTVLRLEAGAGAFYALTARCGQDHCHDYRLARSTAGTGRWSTSRIPATANLTQPSLAVEGHDVLVNYDPPGRGGQPHLLISHNGRGPFAIDVIPALASVGACDLSPEPGGSVWAACPTGMLVSYLDAPRPAGPYRPVWDYTGTGGGGLVPVTATVAYRYTGIAARLPEKLPADVLQRSDDAGRTFAATGPWPFARNVGTTPRFWFLTPRDGFGLGPAPSAGQAPEVVETTDAGRNWKLVLPSP